MDLDGVEEEDEDEDEVDDDDDENVGEEQEVPWSLEMVAGDELEPSSPRSNWTIGT